MQGLQLCSAAQRRAHKEHALTFACIQTSFFFFFWANIAGIILLIMTVLVVVLMTFRASFFPSFFILGSKYQIFGWAQSLLWCSWKENTRANNKPSQSITTNTNKAQSESTELTLHQSRIPPASSLLVKQSVPDAWINVATNNSNMSDCERCHALPYAPLKKNGMLMWLNMRSHYCWQGLTSLTAPC